MKKKKAFLLFLIIVLALATCISCTQEETAIAEETLENISAITEVPTREKTTYYISIDDMGNVQKLSYNPEHVYEVQLYENPALVTEGCVSADIKTTPQTYSTVIGTLQSGGILNLISDEPENSYYQIESGTLTGYVAASSLITGDQVFALELEKDNVFAVLQEETGLFLEPSGDTTRMAQIPAGQELQIIACLEDYYEVLAGDLTGYIEKTAASVGFACPVAEAYETPLVQTQPTTKKPTTKAVTQPAAVADIVRTDLVEAMISYGENFMGVTYVYGGTSLTTGLDCSSFTQQMMAHVGVTVARTSYWQCTQGVNVPVSQRQRGDLLFYAYKSSRVNHVAIYIGDNKILHCSSSAGCVNIAEYNYCGEPVICRRFF